jgi:hypothetical protein
MTTLKKASALFLSIILSNRPHYLCCAVDRILLVYTNFGLYRFLAMEEKLRSFWGPYGTESDSGPANSN